MSVNLLLYTLCLLANIQLLLSARPNVWLTKNRNQNQKLSPYKSLQIIPYISAKLADRTNMVTENIDEKDKNDLIILFTNTKKEVKDAEIFLSEVLRVLRNLFDKKNVDNNSNSNIAWSYYDDFRQ